MAEELEAKTIHALLGCKACRGGANYAHWICPCGRSWIAEASTCLDCGRPQEEGTMMDGRRLHDGY